MKNISHIAPLLAVAACATVAPQKLSTAVDTGKQETREELFARALVGVGAEQGGLQKDGSYVFCHYVAEGAERFGDHEDVAQLATARLLASRGEIIGGYDKCDIIDVSEDTRSLTASLLCRDSRGQSSRFSCSSDDVTTNTFNARRQPKNPKDMDKVVCSRASASSFTINYPHGGTEGTSEPIPNK